MTFKIARPTPKVSEKSKIPKVVRGRELTTVITDKIYNHFMEFVVGDKVKLNIKEYLKPYKGDKIVKEILTIKEAKVRNLGSNQTGDFFVGILYFEEYPDEPYPAYHFIKT